MSGIYVALAITADADTAPEEFALSRYRVDLHDWLAEPGLPLHTAAQAVIRIAEMALSLQRGRQSETARLIEAINGAHPTEIAEHTHRLTTVTAQQSAMLAALDAAMIPFQPTA